MNIALVASQKKTAVDSGWFLLPDFFIRSAGFPLSYLDDLRCDETMHGIAADLDQKILSTVFEQEQRKALEALLVLLQREDISQAIFVSSPDAWRNALRKARKALAEGRSDANSRRAIRVATTYLLRFAAKNETTSFFGPMNYGRVRRDKSGMLDYAETKGGQDAGKVTPLITARRVFLAYWALRTLAARINEDPEIAQNLPLRVHPLVVRADGMVGIRGGGMIRESAGLAALIRKVDGTSTLSDIGTHLGGKSPVLLERLLESELLSRGLQVSSTQLDALDGLKTQLTRLTPSERRDHWLAVLQEWLEWCEQMAGAHPENARELIAIGEKRFVEQTDEAARRGAGDLYEDRAIFYEETRGALKKFDICDSLHKELMDRMAPALSIAAAQGNHEWVMLQAVARATLDRLAPDTGRMDFLAFVDEMRDTPLPHLSEGHSNCAVVDQLATRVADAMQAGTTQVHIPAGQLDLPTAQGHTYALADLFIDAPSPDHIARNEFQVLLRKLHHALPIPGWLSTMHPDRGAMTAAMQAFLQKPGFNQLIALQVQRRNKGFYAFPGRRAVYSEPVLEDNIDTVSAARLEVRADGERGVAMFEQDSNVPLSLYLTLADHQRFAPFAALTPPWMTMPSISLGAFTPRISVGGATIQRAVWTFDAKTVLGICSQTGLARMRSIHMWRKQHQLPERVFASTQHDSKPVFVDLFNETSLEILAAMARGTEVLTIKEMFPDRDGLFLHHRIGGCTSEIRIGIARCEKGDIEQ